MWWMLLASYRGAVVRPWKSAPSDQMALTMKPMAASMMAIPSLRARRTSPTTIGPKSLGAAVLSVPQKPEAMMASDPAMAKATAVQRKPFTNSHSRHR